MGTVNVGGLYSGQDRRRATPMSRFARCNLPTKLRADNWPGDSVPAIPFRDVYTTSLMTRNLICDNDPLSPGWLSKSDLH
jgi:hypothetical protein